MHAPAAVSIKHPSSRLSSASARNPGANLPVSFQTEEPQSNTKQVFIYLDQKQRGDISHGCRDASLGLDCQDPESSRPIRRGDRLCSLRDAEERLRMNLHNTLMSLIPAFTFQAAAHSAETLPFPPLCPGIPPHPHRCDLESVSSNPDIWNSVVMNSEPYSSTCKLSRTAHLWIPIYPSGVTRGWRMTTRITGAHYRPGFCPQLIKNALFFKIRYLNIFLFANSCKIWYLWGI